MKKSPDDVCDSREFPGFAPLVRRGRRGRWSLVLPGRPPGASVEPA